MPHRDLALYVVHIAFWSAFGITRLMTREADKSREVLPPGPEEAAPHSRLLLAFHMAAFALMYAGIGNAVLPDRVPEWFEGQRTVGTLVIALGAAMMCWALLYFKSWRFRAALTPDHQLATGGPFQYVRHPIYLGLDLLALGSALWVPTSLLWSSVILMLLGSDLRGRAEEKLLVAHFGNDYLAFMRRTKRFLPGVY